MLSDSVFRRKSKSMMFSLLFLIGADGALASAGSVPDTSPVQASQIGDPVALIGQILREGDLNALIPAGPLREGIKLRPLGQAEIVGLDTAVNVLRDEIRELKQDLSKTVGLNLGHVNRVRNAIIEIVERIVGYEPHRSVVVILNRGLLLDRVLVRSHPEQVHLVADNLLRTLSYAETLAVNLAGKRGTPFNQLEAATEYDERAAQSASLYILAARQAFSSVDLRFAVNMLNLSLLMNDLYDSAQRLAFGKMVTSLRAQYQIGVDEKGVLKSASLSVYEKEQFNRTSEKLLEDTIRAVAPDQQFGSRRYSVPHFTLSPNQEFRVLLKDAEDQSICARVQLLEKGTYRRGRELWSRDCQLQVAAHGLQESAALLREVTSLIYLRFNSGKSILDGGTVNVKGESNLKSAVDMANFWFIRVGWTGTTCAVHLAIPDPDSPLRNPPSKIYPLKNSDGTTVLTDPRVCLLR